MKNITWNKVKTTVKDWQVGDYIRQTLWGTERNVY